MPHRCLDGFRRGVEIVGTGQTAFQHLPHGFVQVLTLRDRQKQGRQRFGVEFYGRPWIARFAGDTVRDRALLSTFSLRDNDLFLAAAIRNGWIGICNSRQRACARAVRHFGWVV